jgi:RNA polymerase sigma-70 factor (ECF subfamily)
LIFREVEDRDLIAQARRDNVEAYNLLVSRWEKRIFNYLLRLVKNREDALDLSQDVFSEGVSEPAKTRRPSRFAPWLYRIAHNEAYSMLRKNRPETDLDDAQHEPWLEPGPTRRMLPIEVSLAVERALERLSNEQREAVVLKIYQGLQVRRNGRNPRLPGFDSQISALYGPRPLEGHPDVGRRAG